MTITVILGAGFSFPAGLPLTRDLFGALPPVRQGSAEDLQRMRDVALSYRDWAAVHPYSGAEQWLQDMYQFKDDPLMRLSQGTEWGDIVQYILRRVTPLKRAGHASYYHGISRYSVNSIHEEFWTALLSAGQPLGVVTMNYDILAEQALHRNDGTGMRPIFYYGGLPWGTHVRKMVNLAAAPGHKHHDVPLGQEIPIFKLHGSINWAFEQHSFSMKVHDDVRAAFRRSGAGVPAIIPPIEEKEMTEDFAAIWSASRRHLAASEHWVVVGYSMAPYDLAIREHLERAASQGPAKRVSILDPNAASLAARWMFPNIGTVEALDSLPAGLAGLVL